MNDVGWLPYILEAAHIHTHLHVRIEIMSSILAGVDAFTLYRVGWIYVDVVSIWRFVILRGQDFIKYGFYCNHI